MKRLLLKLSFKTSLRMYVCYIPGSSNWDFRTVDSRQIVEATSVKVAGHLFCLFCQITLWMEKVSLPEVRACTTNVGDCHYRGALRSTTNTIS